MWVAELYGIDARDLASLAFCFFTRFRGNGDQYTVATVQTVHVYYYKHTPEQSYDDRAREEQPSPLVPCDPTKGECSPFFFRCTTPAKRHIITQ